MADSEINALTAVGSAGLNDVFHGNDVSDSNNSRKYTLTQMLNVINNLTTETSAASGDFYMFYDTSANTVKKIDADNIATNNFVIGNTVAQNVTDSVNSFDGPYAGTSATSTAEGQRQWPIPVAATAKTIVVDVGGTNTNGDDTIITLRKDDGTAADTALTVTYSTGQTGVKSFSADVSFAANDLVSLEIDNTLNTGTFRLDSWAVLFEV